MTPAPSSRSGRGKPIGEILLENGAIQPEQLARAIAEQNGSYDLIGRILIKQGACGQAAILAALQAQYRVTNVEITRVPLDSEAISKVTKDICEKGRLIPFDLIGSTICVAMTNVLNRKGISAVEEASDCKVKAFSASWVDIKKVIKAYFDESGKGVQISQHADGDAFDLVDAPVADSEPSVAAAPAPPPPAAPPPAAKPAPVSAAPPPPPPPVAPPAPAPSPEADVAVVPFGGSGAGKKKKKRSGKRDTMRMLKAQLMKDKGEAPKAEKPQPPSAPPKEDIVVPAAPPPPPPVSAPAPVAEEPAADVPAGAKLSGSVVYQPVPEWSAYGAPPAEGLVPSRPASDDAEPAIVKKLRETGHKGSADHEVLDALPVGELFAPSLDDYKVTVSALAALEDVVIEEEPLAPPEPEPAPEPEPLELKPAPTPQPAAPMPTIEAPVVSASPKIRAAIAVSQQESVALAPREGEDREASFRSRFLSSRVVKAVAVE
ncbi:MAG: hypothetical protein JW909_00435 [Planctomycetes bacterium]|nr:hypothetical protein [Planctomycetota bacterium]